MSQLRIIAFAGPKGCGKDTAAAYLLNRNHTGKGRREYFQRTPFAGPMKQICRMVAGLTEEEVEKAELKEKVLDRWPHKTPREMMQHVGNHFRDYLGVDVWVNAWLSAVERSKAGCTLVTDLRFPNELEHIRSLGGLVVYVDRKEAEERLARAKEMGDPLSLNVSESHWELIRAAADHIVPNDGGFDALFNRVHNLTVSTYGNWINWVEVD